MKTKRRFSEPRRWSIKNKNGWTEYISAKTYKQAMRELCKALGKKNLDLRTLTMME